MTRMERIITGIIRENHPNPCYQCAIKLLMVDGWQLFVVRCSEK